MNACQKRWRDLRDYVLYVVLGVDAGAYQIAPPPPFRENQSHSTTTLPDKTQLMMQAGLSSFQYHMGKCQATAVCTLCRWAHQHQPLSA